MVYAWRTKPSDTTYILEKYTNHVHICTYIMHLSTRVNILVVSEGLCSLRINSSRCIWRIVCIMHEDCWPKLKIKRVGPAKSSMFLTLALSCTHWTNGINNCWVLRPPLPHLANRFFPNVHEYPSSRPPIYPTDSVPVSRVCNSFWRAWGRHAQNGTAYVGEFAAPESKLCNFSPRLGGPQVFTRFVVYFVWGVPRSL